MVSKAPGDAKRPIWRTMEANMVAMVIVRVANRERALKC